MFRLLLVFALSAVAALAQSETWVFDNLQKLGGHAVKVEGDPQVIDTPLGKAVEFDGEGDALFLDVHPLAGAEVFTWELIFRPDSDGGAEQRIFHLQQDGAQSRFLFETRLVKGRWLLDAFVNSDVTHKNLALMNWDVTHPTDKWYHVAMVYDGKTFTSYVNREVQLSGEVKFAPQGPGKTSVGVRINRVDYFKGAFRQARFTRKALKPSEFLPIP
ncbi:MAG: LamG domain-containing protein [Acidobacteria bacterium]|nr:LamG domain-containing protein [Acidobacteriota bacterium]